MKLIEVKIRVPEDVHKKLQDMAAKDMRSMNKQITHILQETVQMLKHQYQDHSKGQIK